MGFGRGRTEAGVKDGGSSVSRKESSATQGTTQPDWKIRDRAGKMLQSNATTKQTGRCGSLKKKETRIR